MIYKIACPVCYNMQHVLAFINKSNIFNSVINTISYTATPFLARIMLFILNKISKQIAQGSNRQTEKGDTYHVSKQERDAAAKTGKNDDGRNICRGR